MPMTLHTSEELVTRLEENLEEWSYPVVIERLREIAKAVDDDVRKMSHRWATVMLERDDADMLRGLAKTLEEAVS